MKKIFLAVVLLISVCGAFAQGIEYQKSLSDALSQAGKTGKPIFVAITHIPVNLPANATYVNGFDNKDVVDFYNKKFICYQVSNTDTAANKMVNRYGITIFPTYIFLDNKGQIVYKVGANETLGRKYLEMGSQALARIASGKTISHYEELNKQGAITADELKEYIILKEELGLFDNSVLIDKYVNFLTIGSLDDYNTVLFILKAGPYAYSKAFNLAYTNKKITDSIYKHEPQAERSAINNHIILNTRNEAIKTKNMQLLQNVASFARGTWGNNYIEANKASTNQMLIYYRAVKDTLRYYPQAAMYYDTYYMNISTDSAKKLQRKTLDDMKNSFKIDGKTPAINNANSNINNIDKTRTLTGVMTVRTTTTGGDVASTLNNAAYEFYTMGTHNTNYLIKALVWCRRAIELQPIPGYYDTMAHVMYRLNFYDEAILNQNKSIELAAGQLQTSPTELEHLKAELVKMQRHEL